MGSGRSDAVGGGVQSVDRALIVLEILARLGEAGVTEIASELDVHKSTASRLLSSLEDRDLVEQLQDRGKYRLGVGILRLANAVSGELDVVQQGRDICERLAADVGETVNVAVRRSGIRRQRRPGEGAVRGRHPQLGRRADAIACHVERQGAVGLDAGSDPARTPRRRAPDPVHRPHDYVTSTSWNVSWTPWRTTRGSCRWVSSRLASTRSPRRFAITAAWPSPH